VMLVTVTILVLLVQLIQVLGDRLVARFSHR
jgi:ABC-type methionine transport system permease subunit